MGGNAENLKTGATTASLPPIPCFETRQPAAEHLMQLAPDRLADLLACCRRQYGAFVLRLGDEASWRWLQRSRNPYRDEIDAIARRLGEPGAVMLNMSYEWTCTAGVGADPSGTGSRLRRALDWPLAGLGRTMVVAKQPGAAGAFHNVTWPGYVGVLTATAPGRFSASINQPPLPRTTGLLPIDWIAGRARLWRQNGLPPAHLLRRVFETCADYGEAKRLLVDTPLCLPAFFTLSGLDADEGCVIERRETQAVVHEAPAAISNHWRGFRLRGHDRGKDSPQRCEQMQAGLATGDDGLGWLVPPILNSRTRLAAVANAARGRLVVQGWERDGPATGVLTLDASPRGDQEPAAAGAGGAARPG